MSTKRTAAESNNDEQTTEDSDPVSQQQSDRPAKRAKLVLLSDTRLEDLPIELLKCILVEVVAKEVKDMKFAKSVWKEKADHVINRLCTVCSRWNSICATTFFRTEVHRTMDATAQKTIRFEIVHQFPMQFDVLDMTVMNDEIFILCKPNNEDYIINVFDCNNMAEVKDVIQLPGINPWIIAGCSVSNCVYVHHAEEDQSIPDSVYRITKADENQLILSPWMVTDQKLLIFTVSANGYIITISEELAPNPAVLSIYAANGSLQRKVVLYPDIYGLNRIENVIQKSNGNLVLISEGHRDTAQLREIDTFGSFVRQYQSSICSEFSVNFADIYDRILITNGNMQFELLDSEFNLLDVSAVPPNEALVFRPRKLYFNVARNEIMSGCNYLDANARGLTVFRFI